MNGRQQQQQQHTKEIPRRLRASASAALKIVSADTTQKVLLLDFSHFLRVRYSNFTGAWKPYMASSFKLLQTNKLD